MVAAGSAVGMETAGQVDLGKGVAILAMGEEVEAATWAVRVAVGLAVGKEVAEEVVTVAAGLVVAKVT
jgi:hypothetical protein